MRRSGFWVSAHRGKRRDARWLLPSCGGQLMTRRESGVLNARTSA